MRLDLHVLLSLHALLSPNSNWLVTSSLDATRSTCRAVRQARHSKNLWARHVERVVSCRDVTSQVKFGLYLYAVWFVKQTSVFQSYIGHLANPHFIICSRIFEYSNILGEFSAYKNSAPNSDIGPAEDMDPSIVTYRLYLFVFGSISANFRQKMENHNRITKE